MGGGGVGGRGGSTVYCPPTLHHFFCFVFIRIADLLIGVFFIFAFFIPFNPPFAFLKLGWGLGRGVKIRAPRSSRKTQ